MPAKRPNILIFMTDQQRGATVLPEHPVKTPRLDRFVEQGLLFDNARCPAPHCCPSRATFWTGLYPTEHQVWHNINVQNAITRGPVEGTRYWHQELLGAGYRCVFTGKWHVDACNEPIDLGWDQRPAPAPRTERGERIMGLRWQQFQDMERAGPERAAGQIKRPGYGDYSHYGINENPFNDQGVVDIGKAAIPELAAGDDPWCLFVGTLGPHDAYNVPQRFLDLYKDVDIQLPDNFDDLMKDKPALYQRTRGRFDQLTREEHIEAIRHYWAFCSYEDWLFGQLLDELEQSGQADDTLVIYTSDHGDYLGEHGLWCKGLPCFKGAYDIPLAMRWPAGISEPGRRISAKVGLEDFGRTFLELSGCEAAADWPGSGRSLTPFLRGETPSKWRTAHFTQSNGNELFGIQRSIDTGAWKYVYNGFDFDELYDLKSDPGETRNLASDPAYADTVEELCRRVWSFAYEHGEQSVNRYIMVALAPVGPASAFDQNHQPIPSGG